MSKNPRRSFSFCNTEGQVTEQNLKSEQQAFSKFIFPLKSWHQNISSNASINPFLLLKCHKRLAFLVLAHIKEHHELTFPNEKSKKKIEMSRNVSERKIQKKKSEKCDDLTWKFEILIVQDTSP